MKQTKHQSMAKNSTQRKKFFQEEIPNSGYVDMKIYPNPTTNEVNLHFVSEEVQDVTIKVVDTYGKQVFYDDRTNFVGEYAKAVALGEYAKGVYFLQITTKDNTFYEQIIVQ